MYIYIYIYENEDRQGILKSPGPERASSCLGRSCYDPEGKWGGDKCFAPVLSKPQIWTTNLSPSVSEGLEPRSRFVKPSLGMTECPESTSDCPDCPD